ncbi:MAG: co-chaperone GroES [Candidatus Brocadiaceae bacterium]|nr:co-chaperone GroES [Candidatus Brocadiaceae bacterium]
MAKIKPLDDRVVLEILEQAEKTRGGIFLPDTAKEKPQQGRIVAAGPGKVLENGQRGAMTVKKGDVVIFAKYSGTEVEVDGKELLILRESDLLAVVEN